MKKVHLLVLAAGALLLAACAESSTAPSQMQTKRDGAKPAFDISCPYGYTVAYDDNGDPYCAAASTQTASTATKRP